LTEHRHVLSLRKRQLQHAIACGEWLTKIKAELGHGNWLPWARKHIVPEMSITSAEVYMRLAKHADAVLANSQATVNLSIELALQGIAKPKRIPPKIKADSTLKGIRILTGDCRDLLKTLPADSVHCVCTSPPYHLQRDYHHPQQIGLESTPE